MTASHSFQKRDLSKWQAGLFSLNGDFDKQTLKEKKFCVKEQVGGLDLAKKAFYIL